MGVIWRPIEMGENVFPCKSLGEISEVYLEGTHIYNAFLNKDSTAYERPHR